MVDLKHVQAVELLPGFSARMVHSERMTFVYWDIACGAQLPAHSHPHEQVAHVLEGFFELNVDGIPHVLGPGQIYAIPSEAEHSGKALTSCKLMDAFAPVREDYLAVGKD